MDGSAFNHLGDGLRGLFALALLGAVALCVTVSAAAAALIALPVALWTHGFGVVEHSALFGAAFGLVTVPAFLLGGALRRGLRA